MIVMCDSRWILASLLLISVTSLVAWDKMDLDHLLVTGECNGCDLEGVDLRNAQLNGAKLRWAKMNGSDLQGTDLQRADLTGADLQQSNMTGTHLDGAIMQGAKLRGVDLSETSLIGVDLRWADITHLNVDVALESIDLIGVLLEGARFDHGVRCGPFPAKGGFGCASRR